MTVTSDKKSPVVHLKLVNPPSVRIEEDELLQSVVDKALEGGVMMTRAHYIAEQEKFVPSPSIRIYVSVAHSESQIKQAVEVIKKAASDLL
jgi:serine palmitoyltransferase